MDENLYSCTHLNHPSSIWVRESHSNYIWTYDHFKELCREYTFRYDKIHATQLKLSVYLGILPDNIELRNFTLPPSCMPDEFKVSTVNPIANYRQYYNYGKRSLLFWSKRTPPNWIDGKIIQSNPRPIYTIER